MPLRGGRGNFHDGPLTEPTRRQPIGRKRSERRPNEDRAARVAGIHHETPEIFVDVLSVAIHDDDGGGAASGRGCSGSGWKEVRKFLGANSRDDVELVELRILRG
jgi:hypothetical protein